jgi:hypothetical protein
MAVPDTMAGVLHFEFLWGCVIGRGGRVLFGSNKRASGLVFGELEI